MQQGICRSGREMPCFYGDGCGRGAHLPSVVDGGECPPHSCGVIEKPRVLLKGRGVSDGSPVQIVICARAIDSSHWLAASPCPAVLDLAVLQSEWGRIQWETAAFAALNDRAPLAQLKRLHTEAQE